MGMAGKAEPTNHGRKPALRRIQDPKQTKIEFPPKSVKADLKQRGEELTKKGQKSAKNEKVKSVKKDLKTKKKEAAAKEAKERAKAKEVKAKEAKAKEAKEQAKAKETKEQAKAKDTKEQAKAKDTKAKETKAKEAKAKELKEKEVKNKNENNDVKPKDKGTTEPAKELAKPAPVTPPPRRIGFKSPESSAESVAEAACAELDAKRKEAESVMRKGLREALEKAELKTEVDAHNLEEFLDICISENPATTSLEKKLRGTTPVNPGKDENLRRKVLEEKTKKEAAKENSLEDTEEYDEAEAEESEQEEEDQEVEESEAEESSDNAVEASDDEGTEKGQEVEEVDMDESEGSEEEEEEEEDEEEEEIPEPEPKRRKQEKEQANNKALQMMTESTKKNAEKVRNSTTHKKDWDTFMRQVGNKSVFPASLAGTFLKSKTDLFGLWLDNSRNWKEVTLQVERKQQSTNMERNQLQAVKARELKKTMDETKYKALIEKRMSQGLWYKDTDFPEDEEDFKGVSYAVLLVS